MIQNHSSILIYYHADYFSNIYYFETVISLGRRKIFKFTFFASASWCFQDKTWKLLYCTWENFKKKLFQILLISSDLLCTLLIAFANMVCWAYLDFFPPFSQDRHTINGSVWDGNTEVGSYLLNNEKGYTFCCLFLKWNCCHYSEGNFVWN